MLGLDGKKHTLKFDLDFSYHKTDEFEIVAYPTFQFDEELAYKLLILNDGKEKEILDEFTMFAGSCMVYLVFFS